MRNAWAAIGILYLLLGGMLFCAYKIGKAHGERETLRLLHDDLYDEARYDQLYERTA